MAVLTLIRPTLEQDRMKWGGVQTCLPKLRRRQVDEDLRSCVIQAAKEARIDKIDVSVLDTHLEAAQDAVRFGLSGWFWGHHTHLLLSGDATVA